MQLEFRQLNKPLVETAFRHEIEKQRCDEENILPFIGEKCVEELYSRCLLSSLYSRGIAEGG